MMMTMERGVSLQRKGMRSLIRGTVIECSLPSHCE